MKTQFEILKTTRKNIITLLDSCTENQLLNIPNNYNNNILWNAAHSLVSMHLLCYKLSENSMTLGEDYINAFRKGSKATKELDIDIAELKNLLITSANQLEEDYNKGLFKKYAEYPTSYGFTLNSIEDAISFNNLHEGLHYGYMLAQKRAI